MKKNLFRLGPIALTALMALSPPGAEAASFDCSKAKARLDKLICANQRLSQLDDRLNQDYRKALAQAPSSERVKAEQRTWLKSRSACPDLACLEQAYRNRIAALRMGPSSIPAPNEAKSVGATRYAGMGDAEVGQNEKAAATFVTTVTIQGHDQTRLNTSQGEFFWAPWMPPQRVEAMRSMAEGLNGQRARITYSKIGAQGEESQCWVEAIARNISFLEKRAKSPPSHAD